MKKRLSIKKIVGVLIVCCVICTSKAYAQDVSMHTQGIMQQEFLNPAYNSFKDYMSIAFYNRMQWGNKFEYSPETYVTNLFMPINKTRLGANLGVIVEDIGLRKTTEFKLSLCHNIQLTQHSFLAFGYSVGFLQNSFDRNKIINYPDEDISFLLTQTDLNSTYPTISLGMLFLTKKWFFGISSMATNIKSNVDDSQYFPGFDFSCAARFRLSSWLQMRPGIIVKYYNEKGIKSINGVVTDSYKIPVVYDFAANFLLVNKVWLGTSHRTNQAQTFSLDMKIGQNMKLGYTFELGIGDGLNQFNSHGMRLSYYLKHKKGEETKEGLDILPSNDNQSENMASFI